MTRKAMHFTPSVLLSAPRRSAGVPSPDGTKVLYTVSSYSFETRKKTIELRVLDVASGNSHELAHDDEISDLTWLDNDEFVCLQSEKNNSTSVYWASVGAIVNGGGKAVLGKTHYIAGKIAAPASSLKLAKLHDGSYGVVVSALANADGSMHDPEAPKTHSTGKLYDSLYVRHWDTYITQERNALWYGKLSKSHDGKWSLSDLYNALRSTALECPIQPFGGGDHFDVSPEAIIFVAKDPELNPALNTKCNVYITRVQAWDAGQHALVGQVPVPGFEGAATSPVWSPDGRRAAFLMMKHNGYEADRNRVFVLAYRNGEALKAEQACALKNKDSGWDRSPSAVCFSKDGQSLFMLAEETGFNKLFHLPTDPTSSDLPRSLTQHGTITDMRCMASGNVFLSGSTLVDNSFFVMVSATPGAQDIWRDSITADGSKLGLSRKQVDIIWTPANNPKVNKEVMSWVVRPRDFDPKKKYPVAYLIHGGPQGAWNDAWSTRWNPAVFAEQGYIAIAPNVTGSTGYGQGFTDAIRYNWGGDPYEDIVKLFDWVGKNMPEADNEKAVMLGASYGGYMANWIQGHDLGRKFKAIVCHDGIFGLGGMLSTEELYFPFHDLGGTPWFKPANVSKQSNANAQQAIANFGSDAFGEWRKWMPEEYLSNWSTPQLVIHSSKDYRLPISEGLSAFNVLQARGVPSQFLTFPDENHWVLKPENSLVWHKVVINWINKYVDLPPYTEEDPKSDAFFGGLRAEEEEVVEIMPQSGHTAVTSGLASI